MKFGRSKAVLLAALFALVLSAPAFATVLYTQPYGISSAGDSQERLPTVSITPPPMSIPKTRSMTT